MTLTYPTLSVGPSGVDFRIVPICTHLESPLNGKTQSQFMGGAHWETTLDYSILPISDARILSAFQSSMRGMSGLVYMGPLFHAPIPQLGMVGGTQIVSGANQVGVSLITTGWAASSTVLKAGDFVQVITGRGQQLLIMTRDIISDSYGNATLYFRPNLRSAPSDGAAIITTNPTCVMMMKDDAQCDIGYEPPILGKSHMTFVEIMR